MELTDNNICMDIVYITCYLIEDMSTDSNICLCLGARSDSMAWDQVTPLPGGQGVK